MEGLRMFVVCLISLCLGLTGCKQLQPVVSLSTETTKTTAVTETRKDSIVTIPADSASIRALLECDSLNQVIMRDLQVEKGRKIAPEVKWLPGGVLEVKMPVDSEAVYLSWKEKHTTEVDSVKVSKVFQAQPQKPPWYDRISKFAFLAIALFLSGYLLFCRK